MNRHVFPLELRLAAASAATGEIEGYASVFGVRDSHGDIIEPGAFRKTLATRESDGRPLPAMYMQHGAALGADPRPVGVWEAMSEDRKGLRVKGRLIGLDTDVGRYNLALVRDGAMRGLSIGFRVPTGGATRGGDGIRRLSAVDLFEVSIVDAPSNARSTIDGLKAAEVRTASDLAGLLRRVGFNLSDARALAAGGWPALKSQSPPPSLAALTARVTQAATSITKGTGQ